MYPVIAPVVSPDSTPVRRNPIIRPLHLIKNYAEPATRKPPNRNFRSFSKLSYYKGFVEFTTDIVHDKMIQSES